MGDDAGHILHTTALSAADVSIAHQGETVALDLDDAMKHVVTRAYLCQHGIADTERAGREGQLHLVAHMLKEGAHAVALDPYRGRVVRDVMPVLGSSSVADGITHHSQQYFVGVFSTGLGIDCAIATPIEPPAGRKQQAEDAFD